MRRRPFVLVGVLVAALVGLLIATPQVPSKAQSSRLAASASPAPTSGALPPLASPSATITPTPPATHHPPTATPTPGTGAATPPQHIPRSGPPPDQVFGPLPPFKALPSAPGPVPPVARGRTSAANPAAGPLVSCGSTTPTIYIDENPSWDFLGLYLTVVPAPGCSPTAYYYDVSWNGATYQRFAPNPAY